MAVAPVVPSPAEFGYRNRLTFRVGGRRLGFYAGGTHELVPVERCLLADELINHAVPMVAELIARLHATPRRVEIAASALPGRVTVHIQCEQARDPRDDRLCEKWLESHPEAAGLVLRGRKWERRWGDTAIVAGEVRGAPIHTPAGSFAQVNAPANRMLVECVLALAGPVAGAAVADLHAGAGNFALPLASAGARVSAVESDPRACKSMAENARRLGLPVEVTHGRADQCLASWLRDGRRFRGIVLDPPRSGAADCVEPLMGLAPEWIVYVSCNPATLARDLRRLAAAYRVVTVQPFDLFPQTYHVETVVRLERAVPGST